MRKHSILFLISVQILSYFLGLRILMANANNIKSEAFVINTVTNRLKSPTIYRPLSDIIRHPNNTILRLWYFPSMLIKNNNRQVIVEIEDGNNAWFEGIVYGNNNEICRQYSHRSNISNSLVMLIETFDNSNFFDEPSIDDSLRSIGRKEILEVFHQGQYHFTVRKEYQNNILEDLTRLLLASVFEDMQPPSMPDFFFSENYHKVSHSNDSSVVKLYSNDWKSSDHVFESLGFPHEVRSRPNAILWTYFLADRSVFIVLFDAQMKIVSLRLDFWETGNSNDVSIIWKRQWHQVYPIDHKDIWKWIHYHHIDGH